MDVFVSYSSKDTEFIQKMCAVLKSHGISYWAAYEKPSESNTNATVNQICDAGVLLVFVSKNSNQSKHVINEVNCASMYNKPILPVIIDDVEISQAFEYYIAGANRLYYSQSADFIEPFINMIRSMIGSGTSLPTDKSAEHTAITAKPHKDKIDDRKTKKTPIIITLIVALLAVATAVAVVLLKLNKKPTSDSVPATDSVAATDSTSATGSPFDEGMFTFPYNEIITLDFITKQDNTETVTEDTETTTDKAVTTNTTTAATTNKTTEPTTAKPTTTITKAPVSKPSAKPTGKDLLIGDWNAKIPADNFFICLTVTFKADGTVKSDLTRDNYNNFMMSIVKDSTDGLTDKEIAEQGFSSREEAINSYFEMAIQKNPYENTRATCFFSGKWTLIGDTLILKLSYDGDNQTMSIQTGLSEGKTSFTITDSGLEVIFTKIK